MVCKIPALISRDIQVITSLKATNVLCLKKKGKQGDGMQTNKYQSDV